MRIPKIKKRTSPIEKTITTIDINKYELPEITYNPDVDFEDSKSVEHYVKACKMIIRNSKEYKELMSFLKSKMGMDTCFFLPNVKKEKGSKVSIEMHHTGFVMEDIIKTILYDLYDNDEEYDCQSVAEKVMYYHYKGFISLTALSSTAHQLIHEPDSMLFIPLGMEDFGDINLFFEEFIDTIKRHLPDLYKKFESYKMLSETVNNIEEIIPEYMDVNIIYYNCEGIDIPSMDKILDILSEQE